MQSTASKEDNRKEANKENHKKWEYMTVPCRELRLRKYSDDSDENYKALEQNQSTIIDPKIWEMVPRDEPRNPRYTEDHNAHHYYRLAWVETKKFYTSVTTCLNKLGKEGWEVVAVTPPWQATGYYKEFQNAFDILLKRPNI